ncbi:MAG: hypothetical protein NT037_15220 [Hyphomicrobiales bacterium]|nr:hypothetical protein [Hyphomicrobiales bacterium]
MRALVLLPLLLAACAPHVGDLGRARPSVWNESLLPAVGDYVAWARDERVSPFHLTDDEVELRNRAWRFVMPAHERSWFLKEVQELARSRIIPVSWQSVDPNRYRVALLSDSFRSEHSRYRRLAEDVVADTALIAPFRAMAQRVRAADKVRLQVAGTSLAVTPPMPEHAEARVAENEGLVAWVRERMRHRLHSYRHALENLVVELPSREAVAAERAIMALDAEVRAFDGLVSKTYRLGPPPTVVKH